MNCVVEKLRSKEKTVQRKKQTNKNRTEMNTQTCKYINKSYINEREVYPSPTFCLLETTTEHLVMKYSQAILVYSRSSWLKNFLALSFLVWTPAYHYAYHSLNQSPVHRLTHGGDCKGPPSGPV